MRDDNVDWEELARGHTPILWKNPLTRERTTFNVDTEKVYQLATAALRDPTKMDEIRSSLSGAERELFKSLTMLRVYAVDGGKLRERLGDGDSDAGI